jgi:hypothetical protein
MERLGGSEPGRMTRGHLYHVGAHGRAYHTPVAARIEPQRDADSERFEDTTMKNVQRYATRYAMLVAVVALAACGSDDKKSGTGPDGGAVLGNFSATLTGDIGGSLSGLSAFASANTAESQGFVLAMEDTIANSTASAAILFVKQTPALPGVGTHEVVDFEDPEAGVKFGLFAAVIGADGSEWVCTATEGTITVSSSSAQRIRGTFNVAAECVGMGAEEPQAMTLSGNFDARVGQVPSGME